MTAETKITTIGAETFSSLEGFVNALNQEPNPAEIKINEAAGNSKYIPISHIEMELDERFMGLWETENFRWSVIANEIVGAIDLRVYHPIARVWIKRTGAAAAMIQQKKDSDITDISAKFKNTLVKDFPHLEAECIKSAAKKLGKMFGRDLNRKHDDAYHSIYSEQAEISEDIETIKEKLSKCNTVEALNELYAWYTQYHENRTFKNLFSARKRKIQLQK